MTSIGSIQGLAVDQADLRARLETLSRQVSTGRKGPVYGDLGPEARRSLDLRAEIGRRDAYAAGAERALGRAQAAQDVLGRLQTIAADVASQALRTRTLGATGVEAMARSARAALEEAAALLNSRHAGEYLFAGSDLGSAPVPDAGGIATGALATAIAAEVATLDPTNAATILANAATLASDAATTPFNAFLEGAGATEARRTVQVGDGERVPIGVVANRASDDDLGASWGRAMLQGFAILSAMTVDQAGIADGFDDLLAGVHGLLGQATEGVAAEQGGLGTAERRIGAAAERDRDLLVALRAQLALAEEVDLAEASARLTQLQSRLQASYEATAILARISLADYLR
jgi:flagellar hook-associated protein 3 FlgL